MPLFDVQFCDLIASTPLAPDQFAGRRQTADRLRALAHCVFRKSVTDRFGIVTAEFGNVTEHFGDVTDGSL